MPRTPYPRSPFPPSRNTESRADVSATDVTTAQSTNIPEGIVPLAWYATPGASATGTAMSKAGVAAVLGVLVPFRGSIIAMTVSGTAAKAGGTATFTARVNGTDTSAMLVWDNAQRDSATFAKGAIGFDREDYLDVTFTTNASYTPTSTVVEVILWVLQDNSEAI